MAAMTSPTSPMMPTSTSTFLLIEDGSISTWIFLEAGEKASSRPVTRSSKRAPRHTITSQSCMALLASKEPCMPSIPSHWGSAAGKAPRPIRVEVTGAPVSWRQLAQQLGAPGDPR